jgi:hypothetical protein
MHRTEGRPPARDSRRRFLTGALAVCALGPAVPAWSQRSAAGTGSLTKEARDLLTPSQVLGNPRNPKACRGDAETCDIIVLN